MNDNIDKSTTRGDAKLISRRKKLKEPVVSLSSAVEAQNEKSCNQIEKLRLTTQMYRTLEQNFSKPNKGKMNSRNLTVCLQAFNNNNQKVEKKINTKELK